MSGKSGGKTQTTTNSPPAHVQPYSQDYLAQAQGVANQPYQPYGGARVADFTPSQNLGFGMSLANAMGSFGAGQDANRTLQDTINGKYLTADSNPYLSGAVDTALGKAGSAVNNQFSGNNYGSSGHEEWLGRSLANTALPFYSQNYQNERNNQLQASMYAPGLSSSNIAAMQAGGLQQQGLNQQLNDVGYNEYLQALGFPYQQLNTMGGAIANASGNYGSQTGPNPYQTNRLGAGLGGAATAAGLASLFGASGGTLGAAALAGGALGGFGS